jgi:hypothetical protein
LKQAGFTAPALIQLMERFMPDATRPPSSDITHLTRIALRMLLAQCELARPSDPALSAILPDIDALQDLVALPTWDLDDLLAGVRLVARHEPLLWEEDPDVDTAVRAFAVDCEREQHPASSTTAATEPEMADVDPRTDDPSRRRRAGPGRPPLPPAERVRNKKISQAGWRTRNAAHLRDYMRCYRLTRRQAVLVMAIIEAGDEFARVEQVHDRLLRRYLEQPDDDLAAAIDAHGRTVAQACSRRADALLHLASLGDWDEATWAALRAERWSGRDAP